MAKPKIDLPKTSFCGKEFGHSRWFRHVGKCEICRVSWVDYKEKETSRMLTEWEKPCGCGCGLIAAYGKDFSVGHFEMTDEIRKKASQRMSDNNPMWQGVAQDKISVFWTGRKRPSQIGDSNVSKRAEVRKKISDKNPMRDVEHREKQKVACSTDKERKRRSELMKRKNPSTDPLVLKKRIETYTKRLAEGKYQIRNNRWKTGWYVRSNGEREWYDSSYELEQMREYDFQGDCLDEETQNTYSL